MSRLVTQDFERTIEAFLESGPKQISSRLVTSITDEVERMPRRRRRGWQVQFSSPTMPVAAVLTLVVVVGVAIALAFNRPVLAPPGETPTASAAASPKTAIGTLRAGERYRPPSFSRTFTFALPAVTGTVIADGASAHGQRLGYQGGAITFHDGVGLPADLCHPENGLLDQLAGAPVAVGEWLSSMPGLTVTPATAVPVDGREALSWDVALGGDCYIGTDAPASAPAVWLQRNEHHRVYAVPTGSAVILVLTWGSGYHGEGEDVLPAVNDLAGQVVASMTFE